MSLTLPDHDLLVVSDLHLSEGRRPGTKRFSKHEDFFFDEEFSRFLADRREAATRPWHLVVAGDLLDLLQVVSTEGADPALRRDTGRKGYGLACGEPESVDKLRRVFLGHPVFFEALAEFIGSGHVVRILKGNHDVELHYPGVQRAFRDELRGCYDALLARAGDPARARKLAALEEGLVFSEWFYFEPGLLWIEHGSQYEAVNSFECWLAPLLPAGRGAPGRRDEIDLPLGSHFVRYLFNRVETGTPSADNVKPATRFIRWLFLHQPVAALRFVVRDGRYFLRKLRRAWWPVREGAYDARRREHERRRGELADAWGADLAAVDALRAPPVLVRPRGLWRVAQVLVLGRLGLPVVVAALALGALAIGFALSPLLAAALHARVVEAWSRLVVESPAFPRVAAIVRGFAVVAAAAAVAAFLWRLLRPRRPAPSYLARRAADLARVLGVRYVVMGHDHTPDLQPVGDAGEYFNTGSWTKTFEAGESLLGGDVSFVFVEGTRSEGGLALRLMEWHDATGEPRLLKLFDGAEEGVRVRPAPPARARRTAAA